MLVKILKFTIIIIFALSGLLLLDYFVPYLAEIMPEEMLKNKPFGFALTTIIAGVVSFIVFGIIGFLLANPIIKRVMRFTEFVTAILSKVPTSNILIVAMGVTIGLIVANLIGEPFSHLPVIGMYIPLILSLVLAIVGAKVALLKHTDITSFFNRIWTLKPFREPNKPNENEIVYSNHKILDTSVIIDGRIVDILKTGFLEGKLIIAGFVLEELQKIADSSDTLKRKRGRRGLDIVKEIQEDTYKRVEISYVDFDDQTEVDAKLVKLAKDTNGIILTNDFNLNKVAEIQGVKVLNINDLANAVKPVVLPGEEMLVFLAKEGKENGQAVAYLDDGTMIVVEGGKKHIDSSVSVVVTSVLQTSAGRMIFARIK
ncbi:MAG TPA: PIN/TRAM domain-containing protein [Candidatus Avacidaminococcus intestinavium]|uniref:PIN/TRAM domain-containing protein n=1 Tax=Candidatus Avacidaminococcus intestinavium TaxID=2840684 RepID=A0A9D1MPD0_9FIRM|nr:PIN/TRAM domain-containing protein [Candidatus Avacidaminococcus intestinavium]